MFRRSALWAFAIGACLVPATVRGQTPTVDQLMASGLQQLTDTRTTGSESAYRAAETTIEQVLIQQPTNARALMARGELKFVQARRLVVQGKIADSVELFQSGMADMDRAVTEAPDRLDLRLIRGLAYGPFPALYNLASIVRGDLETAVRHPDFGTLMVDQRARAWLLLGTAYSNVGAREQAVEAWRAAVSLDPASSSAKEASDRLNAAIANAPFRPDRFPNIAASLSPLLVVVSFTRRVATADDTQTLLKATMKALDGFPGLLSQRSAMSLEAPGMFFLFTWWKDKQAVDNFYYSDFHQQLAGGRGQAMTGGTPFTADQVPTQLGIEVLAPLPGGMQMGGGFIPTELFWVSSRQTGGAK